MKILYKSRILPTAKKCYFFENPLPFNGVSANKLISDNIQSIMNCIENGAPIPQKHYRASSDRKGDELLVKFGIIHLHLVHPGDNNILYLQQYEDFVLLLEVSTHTHLEKIPIGSNFNMYSINKRATKIANEIAELKRQKDDAIRKNKEELQKSIARLKNSASINNIKECCHQLYMYFFNK